jgi:hypothetical protein
MLINRRAYSWEYTRIVLNRVRNKQGPAHPMGRGGRLSTI